MAERERIGGLRPGLREAVGGGLALALMGLLMLGALWTAMAEGRPRPLPRPPSPTVVAVGILIRPPFPTSPPSPTPTVSPGPALVPRTASATPTATAVPVCRPPADWIPYRVQPGDTAFRLATRAGISLFRFLAANCLQSPALFIGQRVYLPVALPPPTPNPTPCGPPADWVPYTVQAGDTLYRLSVRFRVPLSVLMQANCLTTPALTVGQRLYVPPPEATPTAAPPPPPPPPPPLPTETPAPSPTAAPTETPTATPTATPTPSPSATP